MYSVLASVPASAQVSSVPCPQPQTEELRGQAPEWALMDDAHRIERTFRFRDFREALTFVQKVGGLAESEGHHPDAGTVAQLQARMAA
jgi:pterin-4a-carbinolamine dehydratase